MQLFASLTNRIFIATAALAVFAIGFAVYFVSVRVVRDAEAELTRGLLEAGRLVERHRTTLVDTFTVEAHLIADLPKLKAAVATGDPPTIVPIALDYQARVGADLFVVTDRAGRVLAASGAPFAPGDIPEAPGVRLALLGEPSGGLWPLSASVMQVVTVPIAIGVGSPELLGTLSMGFPFDDALAAEFKGLTDSEVAFAVDDRILAATIGEADRGALATIVNAQGVGQVRLSDGDYVALVQPLSAAGAADARAAAGAILILRSRSARLQFLNGLFAWVAGAALLAVVLAVGLSYGVARTVTRPLAAITEAMREMATTGDLTRKISLARRGRWEDEDASLLATTFDTLTDSIARFQREAAQRDRLSSLGRLSTIVAHEIRNPLMIIKASLRTIGRDDVTPAAVREAAVDIDEEVRRLNRVVNDVLDFAKPIAFELAPVDLGALCADCAEATTADGQEPHVRVETVTGIGPIVTDRERLRVALVNILTNARQAVIARADGDESAGRPAVELRLGRQTIGRVQIQVSDQGAGIAEDDLSHVFDPYFTTRRTGSGLGLAIAKNIIEGLGGTIVVSSRPGHGTDIRIELPEPHEV
jgi:signal transduction histidine kinase